MIAAFIIGAILGYSEGRRVSRRRLHARWVDGVMDGAVAVAHLKTAMPRPRPGDKGWTAAQEAKQN